MRHADPWDEGPRLEPLLEAELDEEARHPIHHAIQTYWESPGHPHHWPTGHAARPDRPAAPPGAPPLRH
jgi:hypothetical protein